MKTLINICLSGLTTILMLTTAQAQDPRLSQYYSSPMTINPGMIGQQVSDWRIVANYRSQTLGTQGSQPFTTTTVSMEKNLSGSNDKNILGMGLMLMSDASNGGLLKTNYISAGVAYHNALDAAGKHSLGGGISVNYANRMLDVGKFQFQSQYGGNGYMPTLPANDGGFITKRNYLDVNAGLIYNYKGNRSRFYTGVGYFHAAKPKEGVYANSSFSNDPRVSIQAGYELETNEQGNALAISTIWEKQGNANFFTAGMLYKVAFAESQINIKTINLGVWSRFSNAMIPYVGLESHDWLLGFSYDIPTTKLSGISMQSFECSFAYQFGAGRKKQTSKSPAILY